MDSFKPISKNINQRVFCLWKAHMFFKNLSGDSNEPLILRHSGPSQKFNTHKFIAVFSYNLSVTIGWKIGKIKLPLRHHNIAQPSWQHYLCLLIEFECWTLYVTAKRPRALPKVKWVTSMSFSVLMVPKHLNFKSHIPLNWPRKST